MKRPKISRRAETRPYGRVSAPTRNCRRFLTQLRRTETRIGSSRTAVGFCTSEGFVQLFPAVEDQEPDRTAHLFPQGGITALPTLGGLEARAAQPLDLVHQKRQHHQGRQRVRKVLVTVTVVVFQTVPWFFSVLKVSFSISSDCAPSVRSPVPQLGSPADP